MKFNISKNWIIALILTATALVTFSNGLRNGFLLDDRTFFFSDMKMASPRAMLNYFIPDMRKNLGMDKIEKGANYYRPLAHLTPSVAYLAFKNDTFKHHLLNLFLFILLCFTFYQAVWAVTKNSGIALVSSVLFCVHPVNGLMVDYITAQIFSIQLILMLLCALFYWKNRSGIFSKEGTIALVCFAISLLCHETAMAMPFYLTLLSVARRGPVKSEGRALAPFFILLFVYALFRIFFASLKASVLDKYHAFGFNVFEYLASVMHVAGWYFGQLLSPTGIVLTWVTAPVKANILGHMIVLAAIVFGLWRLVRHLYAKDRLALAALVWTAIGFIPVLFACLFQPKVGITFEPHWMFFASFGFFFWLACLLMKLPRPYAIAAVLLIVIPWIVISRHYNVLWSDEKKYCLNWMEKSPDFRIGYFLLGDVYVREGNFEKARAMYKKYGDDWGVLNNLGLVDMRQGRVEEARGNFLAALRKNPNASMVYTNLGVLEMDAGNLEKAEEHFLKSVELNHLLVQPLRSLIRIYISQGRFKEALVMCNRSLKIAPDDERSLFYRIMMNMQAGRRHEAQEDARRLLAIANDRKMLRDLASLSGRIGFTDIAQSAAARMK